MAGVRFLRDPMKARKARNAVNRPRLGAEPEPEGLGEPGSRIPRLGRHGQAVLPRVGVEDMRANPA